MCEALDLISSATTTMIINNNNNNNSLDLLIKFSTSLLTVSWMRESGYMILPVLLDVHDLYDITQKYLADFIHFMDDG
jgi:hypothetical protein